MGWKVKLWSSFLTREFFWPPGCQLYFAAIVVMKIPFTAVVPALEITCGCNVVVPEGLIVASAGFLTSLVFRLGKAMLRRGRPSR